MNLETTRAYLITVPSEWEDDAVSVLWECGTIGIEMTPAPAGNAVMRAYFHDTSDIRARLTSALARLPELRFEPTNVPQVDWVARVREGFQPVRAGRFRIVPVWQVPNAGADEVLLVVDPGRAFGTGSHETTRLCLRALEQIASRRPLGRVADIGTGSGILAIAANKLGATHAVGVDIDTEAVESASAHAVMNEASISLAILDGARGLRAGRFEVVVANLMAPLLIERRAELAALRSPTGCLVLSGLLATDLPEIRMAFETFGAIREEQEGEWACVLVEGNP